MKLENGKKLTDYFMGVEIPAILINSIDLKIKINGKYKKFQYSKKMRIFFDDNLTIFKNFDNML